MSPSDYERTEQGDDPSMSEQDEIWERDDIIAALRVRVEKLEAALTGLVDRLDEISRDIEFNSVFTLHHIHGGTYSGPTWVDPLKVARAALKDAPQ